MIAPAHRRRCLFVALVAPLALASGASAQTRVLPPGLEDDVARLVFTGEHGAELAVGQVTGAQIESAHIDVELTVEGGRARVRMLERGATSDGRRVGDTPSFTLFLIEGGDDPALHRAALELRARVAARDDGRFFHAHSVVATSEGPSRAGGGGSPGHEWAMRASRAVLWLAFLCVLGLVLRRNGYDPADWRAALILFGAGLALRLWLPPWAPIHANDHGISEMRGLLGHPGPHEAGLYGSAYLMLVRALMAGSDWHGGPFVIGAVAGALGPVALYALARNLAPAHRFGAIAAGFALVVHPIHIRVSLSECPRALAGTLWLAGMALAVYALRPSSRSKSAAWLAAAIAWALAAELRVITLVLPAAGLLFVVLAAGRWRARPSPLVLAACVALVAEVSLFHWHTLRGAFSAASERSFDLAGIVMRGLSPTESVLFDPTLSAWLLPPLLAAAAIRLAFLRQWRLLLAVSCTFALLLVPSLLIWACRTDAIRYQSEAHFPLMLLLLGSPAPQLGTLRGAAWALAPAALIVSALPGWIDATRPDVHAQAYAIAIEHAPPTPIRVAAREMAGDRRVRSEFPDYAIDRPSRVSTRAREGCHVWIGVSCWSFTQDEVDRGEMNVHFEDGAPFRLECAELLGGVREAREALRALTPIEVPHRRGEFHRIPAPRPRVGFAPCPTDLPAGEPDVGRPR